MAKAECERLSFRGSPFLSSGVRAFAFGRRRLEVVFLLRCPKGEDALCSLIICPTYS